MEDWDGIEWLAFGLVIGFGLLILFLLWQSPQSRTGMGLALLWKRLRGRR